MDRYFIIFDVETNGLPLDYITPVSDVDNWPEIIEIAWQLYNCDKELIDEQEFLIYPLKHELNDEVSELTGITQESLEWEGVSSLMAITKFIEVLFTFNPVLIAHNIEFDLKVIQSNFIRNSPVDEKTFISAFDKFIQVCTMKGTTDYCGLPNNKYPKLIELYQVLFQRNPKETHRALMDVKLTSDCFFELLDLNVIQLPLEDTPELQTNTANSFRTDSYFDVLLFQAQVAYENDLNKFPIFYDPEAIEYFLTKSPKNEIQECFHQHYQTLIAQEFEIPYDRISNRKIISLKPRDFIIRYFLVNDLKRRTNFVKSMTKYTDTALQRLIKNRIEDGQKPIMIKIDIQNFYESIEHEKFLNVIIDKLSIKDSDLFYLMLKNSLKVLYKSVSGEIKQKDKGLLIGSKPDEYFAEFFLDKAESLIKKEGINVIRMADEFFYFVENVNDGRRIFKEIEQILDGFGLKINRSKTKVTDFRNDFVQKKLGIEFAETLWGEVISKSSWHTERRLISNGGFRIKEIDENTVLKKPYIRSSQFQKSDSKESEAVLSDSDIEINSYESSITFLNQLLDSKTTMTKFQEIHPEYKYIEDAYGSVPTEEMQDLNTVKFDLYDLDRLKKLKKIIFSFPRSEYYTALAIDLMVFVAKHTEHYGDFVYGGVEDQYADRTEICEFSNLTLIEILDSKDIHDYQKYLLIRCLYKNKRNTKLDINNYYVRQRHMFQSDYTGEDREEEDYYNKKLPFVDEVFSRIESLSDSEYFPLKTVCNAVLATA